MGKDKKHKRHKSEKRDRYEEFSMDQRPSSLKLILKVGSNSTPEYGNDSPAYLGAADPQSSSNLFSDDFPEKHKKSKKKKKKKDREKRHKHHHKEKRRHRRGSGEREEKQHSNLPVEDDASLSLLADDLVGGGVANSSQDELDFNEDSSCTQTLRENMLRYADISAENSPANRPITKSLIPRKLEEILQINSPTPSMSSIKDCAPLLLASPGSASTPGTLSTFGSMTPSQLPNTPKPLEAPKTPSSSSESGREPRTCVLKLKQTKTPLTKLLDHLLRSLEKRDPHQFFAWPVTDDIAPGYSSIITQPMDFSTIRQKIEDNEYSTLTEFSDDFKLMCDNAIKYNHVETVYHKAAKKLVHIGMRLLHPDNLMRSLKPLSGYMRELTAKELGFEFRYDEDNSAYHVVDSADEIMIDSGADEPTQAQLEEEEKRRQLRLKNQPKSKFEPYVDDLTSEEILTQVQNAARLAKKKLSNRQRAHQMGFLRQNKDGTTTMRIITARGDDNGPEKVVNLGAFVGKLEKGTGQLHGFREDRRNSAKIVKSLNYGSFGSFAPVFDSRFSNLSKEETDLILSTYGDATAAEYSESIIEFTRDSSYASILANGLLDYLTQGEHSKTISQLYENQCQRYESAQLETTLPDTRALPENDYEKYKDIQIDYENLKSLRELGIETEFLNSFEKEMKTLEIQNNLHSQIAENFALLDKLHSVQHDRLSQPLPQHLSNIQSAGSEEINLASQFTQNIVDIARKLTPGTIAEPHSLRKAMGMSNVGLQSLPQQRLVIPTILQDRISPSSGIVILTQQSSGNTIPMETDNNSSNQHHDLETELREFLENGSDGLVASHSDDNTIEQMLLN